MREIKLRAWDNKFGDMVSWQVILTEYNLHTLVDPVSNVYDRYKLMQYTGLKDDDGIEIYEGDIVRSISAFQEEIGVVVFQAGGFVLEILESETAKKGNIYYLQSCREKKVIGNIKENPELLEGGF